jgi:hypothetical protein
MEKATSNLYELIVLSLGEPIAYLMDNAELSGYPVEYITLYGKGNPESCMYSEMGERFEFLGFL